MRLFTEQQREDIQKEIIEYLSSQQEVTTVIIVGSGAYGFRDQYSDLDFSVALSNNTSSLDIMDRIRDFLSSKYNILEEVCILKRSLQILVLDNYLEIDIGYVQHDSMSAIREHWNVAYDKVGDAEKIMENTWKRHKENYGKTTEVDLSRIYLKYSQTLFTYVFHAVVAVRRDLKWRTIGEINILRDIAVELLGYHYSLETKRFREVDQLPTEILEKMENTLVYESKSEMKSTIVDIVNIIFDELDYYYNGTEQYGIKRRDMMEYIEEVLSY